MTTAARPARAGIWSGARLPVTVGVLGLVFLGAFENRAVLTILPVVARDLDGLAWFGAASVAATATAAVATVPAGRWSDRAEPVPVLYAAVAAFVVAQAVSALAPSMPVLAAGRAVSGAAEGALDTTLAVLVARLYDEAQRPRVFAAFAAAWVVPSLVGPAVVGVIVGVTGWRGVFAAPAALVVPVLALLLPGLRRASAQATGGGDTTASSLGPALVVGLALVGVTSAAALLTGSHAGLGSACVATGLIVLVGAAARLLPAGSLLLRPGLPALTSLRVIVSAAFPGIGTFLPLMLTVVHDATPAVAGLSLTVTGVCWAAGSWLQSRDPVQVATTPPQRLRIAFSLMAVGAAGPIALALDAVGLVAGMAGGALCAVGMGVASPILTDEALKAAPPGAHGAASAAQVVAANIGFALPSAIGGVAVAVFADRLTGGVFVAVMALGVALAAVGAAGSGRAALTPPQGR